MRELSDADVLRQAEALRDHVARGGAASRWLDSKGFADGDRAAILLVMSEEPEPYEALKTEADLARGEGRKEA